MTQKMTRGQSYLFLGLSVLDIALKFRRDTKQNPSQPVIKLSDDVVLIRPPKKPKEPRPCQWGRCNGTVTFGACDRCGHKPI